MACEQQSCLFVKTANIMKSGHDTEMWFSLTLDVQKVLRLHGYSSYPVLARVLSRRRHRASTDFPTRNVCYCHFLTLTNREHRESLEEHFAWTRHALHGCIAYKGFRPALGGGLSPSQLLPLVLT